MQIDKNRFAPYEYEFQSDENNSFGFVTDQEVEYKISFKPTDYLFHNVPQVVNQTFELIIALVFKPEGVKPALDERVPVTIATVFKNFYKELPENVTIYICDSSDGRERARERMFNSWFYDFKGDEVFMKMDVGLDPGQPDKIDFSVIMKLNHPYKVQVMLSIEELKNDFENQK